MNWRKSSYSGNGGSNCIEVATRPGMILVRDSKDTDGPKLTFDREAWSAFAATVKRSLAPDPKRVCTPLRATLASDGRGWPFGMPSVGTVASRQCAASAT